MHIYELPRLTDDERDALAGGYIVMEGVPAIETPAGRAFPIIKFLIVIAVAFALSACALTPAQQKWTGIAAGVLIVGATAAHESGQRQARDVVDQQRIAANGGAIGKPSLPCHLQPDGTCR